IAESATMVAAELFGTFYAIVRLGPVHTAGHPLIKYGCRGNYFFFLRVIPIKNKKSRAHKRISKKKFQRRVLNLLLVSGINASAYWIPSFDAQSRRDLQ